MDGIDDLRPLPYPDHHWRATSKRFDGFNQRLRLPKAAGEVARQLAAGAGRLLDRYYRPDHPGDHTVLIGGYAKGTATRAHAAVDALYCLPRDLCPDAQAGFDGSRLYLREMNWLLREAGLETKLFRDSCLTVGIGPDLRLIPAFAGPDGGFTLAPRRAGGDFDWRYCDPKAEIKRMRDADLASGRKATRLLRMIKTWRDTHAVPLTSYQLELLVVQFAHVWIYQKRSALFYDWMVRDFFFWLTHQAGSVLAGGPGQPVPMGDLWRDSAETAYAQAESACRLERDNRESEALTAWSQLFGPAFATAVPMGDAPPLDSPEPCLIAPPYHRH